MFIKKITTRAIQKTMNKLKCSKEFTISYSQVEPNHNEYEESGSLSSRFDWQFSVQNAEPIRAAVDPSLNEGPRRCMHSLTLGEHGTYTGQVWYRHHNVGK